MRWYHAVEHVGRTGTVVYYRFTSSQRRDWFVQQSKRRFPCVGPPDELLVEAIGWRRDSSEQHSIRETPLLGRMIRAFKKELER